MVKKYDIFLEKKEIEQKVFTESGYETEKKKIVVADNRGRAFSLLYYILEVSKINILHRNEEKEIELEKDPFFSLCKIIQREYYSYKSELVDDNTFTKHLCLKLFPFIRLDDVSGNILGKYLTLTNKLVDEMKEYDVDNLPGMINFFIFTKLGNGDWCKAKLDRKKIIVEILEQYKKHDDEKAKKINDYLQQKKYFPDDYLYKLHQLIGKKEMVNTLDDFLDENLIIEEDEEVTEEVVIKPKVEVLLNVEGSKFIVYKNFLESQKIKDPRKEYDTLSVKLVKEYKAERKKLKCKDTEDESTDTYIDDNLQENNKLPVAPRHHRRFSCYGKECKMNRVQLFLSDVSEGYMFSGKLLKSTKLNPYFQELLDKVNSYFKTDFNSILINDYLDGKDYIADHSDNEDSLSSNMVVGLSVGATRIIKIKDVKSKDTILEYENKSGDVFVMKGSEFQKQYTHGIPQLTKTQMKNPDYQGRRLSFTFRTHNNKMKEKTYEHKKHTPAKKDTAVKKETPVNDDNVVYEIYGSRENYFKAFKVWKKEYYMEQRGVNKWISLIADFYRKGGKIMIKGQERNEEYIRKTFLPWIVFISLASEGIKIIKDNGKISKTNEPNIKEHSYYFNNFYIMEKKLRKGK